MEKLNCFAVTLPGLEKIVAKELESLSVDEIKVDDGGVRFQTTMDGLFRVNLRLRCATRVLIRLAEFRTHSFPELYNKAKKIQWERYVCVNTELDVRASCHGTKLLHTGRVELAVTDAIRNKHALPESPIKHSAMQHQAVLVRMDDDICSISIDTSGERLDRRGYRLHSGKAPLRETIAAGILYWADWQPDEPLLLPMCGSGTFAVEAAWMAGHRAAGLDHDFPFKQWPCFKEKRWKRIFAKAEAMHKEVQLEIFASDLDKGILRQAEKNAATAGVGKQIHFAVQDVNRLSPPDGTASPGLIVCNPPYGDRIKGDVSGIYRQLGQLFKASFEGWRMVVIVPDQGCENDLGLPVKRRLKIKHGGKWVHILQL
ncbi:putative N6-adenine-specific DNA methylase [Mariprofundus aestuarium]|uniref:Putative N6-adenine-specific DNA methylase n=1 Tax=Mariprofundus aestuarium TaxID=1921086 RepID=A0A2K8KX80_MARES|nr:class I SAM-dependent RNA methyltransferase [Mariprofundus aestuarium]ATX79508.1 putative N6-adenine-specific DNA methylase [Mariprofundus aestuarium]